MPPTTPPPEPSPFLPETERGLQEMWEKRLKLETGVVSEETRKHVTELLGEQRAKELLPKKPWFREATVETLVKERILREIVATRRGLYPYIYEKDPKKAPKRELRALTVDKRLDQRVIDPDSREAQALVWVWNTFVDSSNVAEYQKLLQAVNEAQVKDAQTLLQAKGIYDRIMADPENFDIGRLTVNAPPAPPIPGSGRLLRFEQEREMNLAVIASGAPPEVKSDAQRRANECAGNIDALDRRRLGLMKQLGQLESKLKPLTGGIFPGFPNIDAAARKAENIPSILSQTVSLGAEGTKQIGQWLEDEDLPSSAASLVKRYRATGGKKPRAGLVLDDFLEKQFGSGLYGVPKAEKEKHFADLKAALLSEGVLTPQQIAAMPEAPATTPSGAPSTAPAGAPASPAAPGATPAAAPAETPATTPATTPTPAAAAPSGGAPAAAPAAAPAGGGGEPAAAPAAPPPAPPSPVPAAAAPVAAPAAAAGRAGSGRSIFGNLFGFMKTPIKELPVIKQINNFMSRPLFGGKE